PQVTLAVVPAKVARRPLGRPGGHFRDAWRPESGFRDTVAPAAASESPLPDTFDLLLNRTLIITHDPT
ncbi:hypothetical protein, partial [Amycolatopsis sp. lyj-108]|uniref:hypothetical protein n=1 Tax=Amycolatopsis sp. lyj-108 TaxID=2789286 RepID=UPI003978574F